MDISSLEQLSALIDLCRKKNIEEIKLGDISLKFVADAVAPKTRQRRASRDEPIIEDKAFTDEEILMWSAAGIPEMPEVKG